MDLFDVVLAKTLGGGGAPGVSVEPLSVTDNGTYTAESGKAYSPVTVNVPKGITPAGTISLTENGTYDVTQYASANVNVQSGGGGDAEQTLIDLIERDIISIEIPSGVTSIGDYAFCACTALTSIEIPSGVTSIGASAFYDCRMLESIEIPSGVTSIGASAFYGCTALRSIEIPSGVTSIGVYAFYNCAALTSIEIPSSVESIGSNAFNRCQRLTSITVRATTPPAISSNTFNGVPTTANIYVPAESVESYKTASNWSNRAAYIQAITE